MQAEIALDFARSLAYLHSRRQPIVHRDLKPANLMISGNLHADVEQLYLDSGERGGDAGEEADLGLGGRVGEAGEEAVRTLRWGGVK